MQATLIMFVILAASKHPSWHASQLIRYSAAVGLLCHVREKCSKSGE